MGFHSILDSHKILAQFQPKYAAVNADNYAQFTKAIMIGKKH